MGNTFVVDYSGLNICEMLPGSLTFDVSVSLPITEATMAEYTCEVGYELTSGSAQRTCLASDVWDGAEPTCSKVTCPDTYHQVCYNCDIVDGDCPPDDITPATLDECRLSAINDNFLFVEHSSNDCKAFSCQVPPITYTDGSVAIFSSCNNGKYL